MTTTATSDMSYFVLADRASPYLLARVRWPDVAQAITVGSQDWLDDPGLFDLPYDASAVAVTFPQAASVAAAWGRQLRPEADARAPSFIRRMPANWSDLSPAERRALGIESVGKRRISARGLRHLGQLTSSQPITRAVPAQRNGHHGGLLAGDLTVTGVAGNGAAGSRAGRSREVRVTVDGRALVRAGDMTITAGLVDLSEGGVECVLPEAAPMLAPGAMLSGPFLLEIQGTTEQICLDVPGWINWRRGTAAGISLGIAFGELSSAETDGVRCFLATALSRGSR